MIEFMQTDSFLIMLFVLVVLLILGYIANIAKLSKMQKNYKEFITKLGNGKDITEDLREYVKRVEKVENTNKEIINYCENLDKNMESCVQKIGIVRYSAFRDTGSDLSFSLALLDEKNNGVVLNGIYSREMSNIYAKPVENGESTYTLSEEEKQAINKAISK